MPTKPSDGERTARTVQIKPASLGSISTGTLRTEDLLEAFGKELEWQIRRSGDFFSLPENFGQRDSLNNLVGEWQDAYSGDGTEIREDVDADSLLSDLEDALQAFAPFYCRFGAHDGDGADFGFWPCWSEIDELPTVDGSDAARELGEDCKSVNDHGNVTVYGGDGSIILELV